MEQRFGRTTSDPLAGVAFSLVGSGPFLMVPAPWVSNLEVAWRIPPERRFWEALAEHRTVIRYDKPGTGMSRGAAQMSSLRDEVALIGAVAGAVGAQHFDLFGTSMAAAVAAVWAAEHPETVDHLILYGGWARGADIASPAVRDHVIGLTRANWGLGSEVLADIFVPDADTRVRRVLVEYQRGSATAEVATAILRFGYDVDVMDVLDKIKAPTLVLHREHDRAVPVEHGARVARCIPGAHFRSLPGRSHLAWAGDQDSLLEAIRRSLGIDQPRKRRPGLTSRQQEVAALVAEGLSNRGIAERLSIEERSVEGHLDRIRDRLGLPSRAAVAAWWVGRNDA